MGEGPAGAVAAPLPRRPSPGKAEEWPLTASLLTALWERGWEAEWPKARPSAMQVEAAVRVVGVTCAANRLMLMVERERREGREPKPWLGWHLETIQPKADREQDLRVGVAAPADHAAFGKGGQRAID